VVNELASTVSVLAYESEPGSFRLIGSIGTLPPGTMAAENYPADVRVSPDGRFLYVSNRGHDSIAVFAIDADTGALSARGHHRCGGKWPRAIVFDHSGDFLVVANQESDALATHRVDRATGALTSTGERLSLPKPTCIALLG
jgi:6-phosphogluconolactonase